MIFIVSPYLIVRQFFLLSYPTVTTLSFLLCILLQLFTSSLFGFVQFVLFPPQHIVQIEFRPERIIVCHSTWT